MLKFSQRLGEPIKIGDAVVYVTARPGYNDVVYIAIDAPQDVKVLRDDLVIRNLINAGFQRINGDTWLGRRGTSGIMYSTREAMATIEQLTHYHAS